jgi:amidohydrolase
MESRRDLILSIAREATAWRRELHQHPQTMYEETFASQFVQDHLREWGIPFEAGFGGTGVVATIEGQGASGGPVIAFRADMDALDITEQTALPWQSKTEGKMHACGHDGHTSTVLALGRYLQQTKRFAGTVRLVFQPAEEGGRGAYRMVEDGLLDRFPFDEIYAFHNWPYLPAGEFSIASGYMLAAADRFTIRLKGKGGHAAMPNVCTDVIVAGSQMVTALQSLVSREADPIQPAVLSITNFQAGSGAFNVLPAELFLSGTARTFQPALRDHIETRMEQVIAGIAAAFRLEHEFFFERNTDPVYNHATNVDFARAAVTRTFGDQRLKQQAPVMGAEDFGHFLEHRPGCFMLVGQGADDPASPHCQGLHTSRYDFNDDIIPLTVEYFAEVAESRMPLAGA